MYRKNTAGQYLGFVAINAATGATMTGTTGFAAYRVLDGAAQASATGTVTDKGNGQYSFALSQADVNCNDGSILFTMTGMVAVEKTFITTACDPTSATNFGITALPATAISTNASLLTSGTGTDQVSVSAGKVLLQSTQSGVTIPTVTTLTNLPTIPANWITAAGVSAAALNGKGDWLLSSSYTAPPSAASIATAIWQDATAGDFTVASSIGKSLYTSGAVPGAAGGLFIAGTNAATTVTTSFTTTFTGNLTGSVGSVTGAITLPSIPANWITAAGIAADAIGASELATDAVTEIAGGVWDLATSGHTTAGTFGSAMNAAGSAGDPWATSLPGAYGVGTAGKIVGTNLDAAVSSRASPTNITAGTITTVTNLTNAPTAGDLTATMKASVTTAATAATPTVTAGTVSDKAGYSLAASQHVIVDSGTVTNLTNLPAIPTDWLAAAGVSAAAVTKIQSGLSTYAGGDTSGTTTLLARLTATRAGLLDNLDVAVSTRSTFAGGAVASVTAPVTLDKAQTLSAARALDSVADTALTVNDALHCAIAAATGKEAIAGSNYVIKTPSTGTVLRTFTLDDPDTPATRN